MPRQAALEVFERRVQRCGDRTAGRTSTRYRRQEAAERPNPAQVGGLVGVGRIGHDRDRADHRGEHGQPEEPGGELPVGHEKALGGFVAFREKRADRGDPHEVHRQNRPVKTPELSRHRSPFAIACRSRSHERTTGPTPLCRGVVPCGHSEPAYMNDNIFRANVAI